jgi:multicomponent Na+:H+ antiporter subunit G
MNDTWFLVRDIVSAVLLLGGSALAMVAAIGVVRFSSLFSRMHAATKPQVLGLVMILLGIGLRVEDWHDLGLLLLVAVFQLMTAPVAAHMLGRAAYRADQIEGDERVVDERLASEDPPSAQAGGRPDGGSRKRR